MMPKRYRPDETLYFNHPIEDAVAHQLLHMSLDEKEYETYKNQPPE